MTDDEFDAALIGGAFAIAARDGWPAVSVVAAAREAGLKLDLARRRFANRAAILLRFGERADALALTNALESGPIRERLFDLVMRRFDALQEHRAGVLALLRDLPADPAAALLLASATARSMGWMLEAAGVPAHGLSGLLATQGLTGVWLYALRAWQGDPSSDLSGTMAALDRGLGRAEQLAGWVGHDTAAAELGPKPFPDPDLELSAAATATVSNAADRPAPLSDRPLSDRPAF